MMRRFEQWPEILADEIQAAKSRPFSWGTHDCCAFAARVVEAMTGEDFTIRFNGYDSATVAAEVIAQNGGLEAMVRRCLGEPIPALTAQRGDVCLVQLPIEQAGEHGPLVLGLCDGARVVVAKPPQGVAMLPIRMAVKAWRI